MIFRWLGVAAAVLTGAAALVIAAVFLFGLPLLILLAILGAL